MWAFGKGAPFTNQPGIANVESHCQEAPHPWVAISERHL